MTASCVLGAISGAQIAGRLPQRALGRGFALLVLGVAGDRVVSVTLHGGNQARPSQLASDCSPRPSAE